MPAIVSGVVRNQNAASAITASDDGPDDSKLTKHPALLRQSMLAAIAKKGERLSPRPNSFAYYATNWPCGMR